MLKKSLMLAALVGVMTPIVANSWTLTTRVNSKGGTLAKSGEAGYTQSKVGVVMKNYTTTGSSTVTITPLTGWKISKVKNTGSIVIPTDPTAAYDVTVNPGTSNQTVAAWFAKILTNVKVTASKGGTVSPAGGARRLQKGTVKDYLFTPFNGKAVTKIEGLGAGVVADRALPAPVDTPVKVTITVGDTPITVKALFEGVTANAGAPQTVLPGATVALDASKSVNNAASGTLSYSWSQIAGPTTVALTGATTATPSFTAPALTPATATINNYTFKVAVSNGSSSGYAYTTVTVAASVGIAVQKACGTCHSATYTAWNGGTHANNTTACTKCHIGADAGAHPGNIPASIKLSTTPVAIASDANGFVTANACANCHKASHDQWKESLHTLKAKKGPVLLGGSTENISPWALTNWNTMKTYQILGRKANISSKNYIEMYVSVDKKQPQDVAVVIGQDRKQRYAVYYDGSAQDAYVVYSNNGGITYKEKMIDDDGDPNTPKVWERVAMPAQPDRAGYMFLWLEVKLTGATPAMNSNNYEEWRSWQERCIGCHTTGFDRVAYNAAKSAYVSAFAANGNQPPVGVDMRTVYISEWEVSCEACHGAGAEHAQTGDITKIVSPTKLAKGDHVRREVCESCHTRTNKNKIDTATANDRRGFRLGIDSYSDWMDYTSPAWGSGNRQVSIDGKGRRDHQMTMDIQLSKYIHEVIEGGFSYHGNQNCFDCHKTHDVGITKDGVNVFKTNMNSGKYGHDNMTTLATDDGVRSTLRLKDTREALCSPCHVTPAPAGVLPQGVTAPQYASVTDLIKVMNASTPTYGYTFDSAAAVLDTALYATDPTAATNALTLVASNWATEGGRGGRNQHLFNTDAAAATTNKAMGLKPEEYTWEITTSKVGSTTATDYTAIWPWANAASGKTKVYGPLPTGPSSKAPTTTRPWTP